MSQVKLIIKRNDIVKVMSGRDRAKQGKVTQVFPEQGLVVVEGINLRVKHLKARAGGQAGSRVQYAAPLKTNKVMIVCPHCGKTTRPKISQTPEGKKVRLCRKCNESLISA